jgi:hypothetical protein
MIWKIWYSTNIDYGRDANRHTQRAQHTRLHHNIIITSSITHEGCKHDGLEDVSYRYVRATQPGFDSLLTKSHICRYVGIFYHLSEFFKTDLSIPIQVSFHDSLIDNLPLR